jgi:hypothetical protein
MMRLLGRTREVLEVHRRDLGMECGRGLLAQFQVGTVLVQGPNQLTARGEESLAQRIRKAAFGTRHIVAENSKLPQ